MDVDDASAGAGTGTDTVSLSVDDGENILKVECLHATSVVVNGSCIAHAAWRSA
jgi:hypothetical protein